MRHWPQGLPPVVATELVKGGFVATTRLATLADGAQVIVKETPFPAQSEADGLAALAAAGVPVPRVLALTGHTLVLERVTGPPDWPLLGRAIAAMHQVRGKTFGWHRDNWAGRCPQPNDRTAHWPTFFVEHRVRTHLADPLVPADLRMRLERACDGPIQALLPDSPAPVLTHGDLWAGNVVEGRWVVDPEVSYADRELDLAYMQMSVRNPLPAQFWTAYLAELPLPQGYPERRPVLELHHRLLGIRHFGAQACPPLVELLTRLGW